MIRWGSARFVVGDAEVRSSGGASRPYEVVGKAEVFAFGISPDPKFIHADTTHQKVHTYLIRRSFLQTQILSTTLQLRTLAPSPRILAYLVRKGRLNGAVMTIEQPTVHVGHPEKFPPTPEKFEPPPEVVTTPCDPIPRPYYIEGGLRRVAPYHYTYNTYCKERWRGKEILEIFATEFRDRKPEYYVD